MENTFTFAEPRIHRLTKDEMGKFFKEKDSILAEFGTERTFQLFDLNPNKWINMGCGSVLYDAGEHFYWLRTRIAL
jgi:hypothetical protein